MAQDAIRVGIFFGGPSREREISFAGGRTVFDNLDKSLLAPVLFFVDARRTLIELEWPYIYRGTIRDFYPPADYLPARTEGIQIHADSLEELSPAEWNEMAGRVGKVRGWTELSGLIDVAFLALHGEFGEDGQIQGLLESLEIPYTGSGIRASSIGIDKHFQKRMMHAGGFAGPAYSVITRQQWLTEDPLSHYREACRLFGDKVVIRPANQGSSIGVTILPLENPQDFIQAVDKSFFRETVRHTWWDQLTPDERTARIRTLSDIREGLGFPLMANGVRVSLPDELLDMMNRQTGVDWLLEAIHQEKEVLLEGFISGKEFSCIVIRTGEGKSVALPPTEIIKGGEVFDYRSKYLPGLSRKETPIRLPDAEIEAIRKECERLFDYLDFQVYARIDGFHLPDGTICLNDPNTTSGMMPSSFFFHQAAEIGLDPSRFLTYILRCSLAERALMAGPHARWKEIPERLDRGLERARTGATDRVRVAIILGGYSSERHISVESGRNIYEKLASSEKYEPVPVFLTGGPDAHRLFLLPIPLLLKDNADDIRDRVFHPVHHPVLEVIRAECASVTRKFARAGHLTDPVEIRYEDLPSLCQAVFIALHGRPGEDGEVQRRLDGLGLPYNGSDAASSRLTIDKYETLQTLRKHGFLVAQQFLGQASEWKTDEKAWYADIESRFSYPFIAKPVDDGCSSAVKIIRNPSQLEAYAKAIFREEEVLTPALEKALGLKSREEFPRKRQILFETLITRGEASHFLEITGGLVTKWEDGQIRYEIFEPSEALAGQEVLSLEEKFLAGEGQNITPARFSPDPAEARRISGLVRADLERAARILGVTGYARIDAFVRIFADGRVETWIIEVNSLPGMTPATCIFHQASISGYTPFHFIDQILSFPFHERAPV